MLELLPSRKLRNLILTGLSGAGHSSSMKILEDYDFEIIDNVPLRFLSALFQEQGHKPLAIGVDVRRYSATRSFHKDLASVRRTHRSVQILFLDCRTETLLKRYAETRRLHPLAEDRPLVDGVQVERKLLAPLRDTADIVLDTSDLSLMDLRRLLLSRLELHNQTHALICVQSFGYRAGLPKEADWVIDVRFLQNPQYRSELQARDGRDVQVASYIAEDPAFTPFFSRLQTLLQDLLPLYERQGRGYITLAVGCTGGQHRSVFVAEKICKWLMDAQKRKVAILHRELERKSFHQS